MFRFNNPDALLVLLLVGGRVRDDRARSRAAAPAGWCSRSRWSGFGFLTKMLQAFLVLPGVRPRLPARRAGLRCGGASGSSLARRAARSLVSAGWWVAIVELVAGVVRARTSAARRTTASSNLIFGYNGFGRLTGNETGSVGGGAGGRTGQWGPTGLTRLFSAEFGSQISWLLPAALILLVAGLVRHRRTRPRTDRTRAALAALGRLAARHRAHVQLRQGASSTRTTRSRSRRRSARSSASGTVTLWKRRHDVAATHRCSPPPSRSPPSWSYRAARPHARTGTRGCGRSAARRRGVAVAGVLLAALARATASPRITLARRRSSSGSPGPPPTRSTPREHAAHRRDPVGPPSSGRLRWRPGGGFGGGPVAGSAAAPGRYAGRPASRASVGSSADGTARPALPVAAGGGGAAASSTAATPTPR